MPVTADDLQFLKGIYRELRDEPLEPGDPRYQPVYQSPGCEDPMELLQRAIEFADVESLHLFSGFRGSGKTTELYRLRQTLEEHGYVVLYADALDYLNPATPIGIADLLMLLAGSFSDALEEQKINLRGESYWTRLGNYLKTTSVNLKEIGLKSGAELKLELRTTPTFRQKLSEELSGRLGELHGEVTAFFEDGFKAIRSSAGPDARIVFMFDSLEKIRGSLSNEAEVSRSVEVLFSNYLKLLEIPNLHVIYTVPPWLKFLLSGTDMRVLPCVRLWNNDGARTRCEPGIEALRGLLKKRFGMAGLDRFFGPDPFSRADKLIQLCGGHFRDLLLLLREAVLRAKDLPVTDEALEAAIIRVRSNFLPISYEDASWLQLIEEKRSTVLRNTGPLEVSRLTRFLDTHIVLYLRNGSEWYDIHPLVREEVAAIAGANGTGGSTS